MQAKSNLSFNANMRNMASNNNSYLSWESMRSPEVGSSRHGSNEIRPQQETVKAKLKKQAEGHFPFRLYYMLEYATDNGHSWAFSWTDDGHSFTIHQEDWFVKHIVSKFFRQTKFRSFVSPSLYGTCLVCSWLERRFTVFTSQT